MNNVVALSRQPAPSPVIAAEFGRDLYSDRKDSSDPEVCQEHLFDLYPHRLREIVANLEGAMDAAGQMYLDKVTQTMAEAG